MTGDRTGIRATAGNPARLGSAEMMGGAPSPQHCPRQGQPAGCTNDEISGRINRARNALTRFGLRLREHGDCCATAE